MYYIIVITNVNERGRNHLPMKHVHPTSIIEFTHLVRIDLDRMVLIFWQSLIDPKEVQSQVG